MLSPTWLQRQLLLAGKVSWAPAGQDEAWRGRERTWVGKKVSFWQSLVARRGGLLGSVGRERGVSSRSAAPCAYPGTGVWLVTSTLEVVRFLIAINILPFPQSFCKKRAGLVSTSSFPSLGWGGGGLGGGGGEPQGAGAGRGGKARAGLRQGMGFSVLMTDCKSPKPQLGDGVTSATWLSLRWLGARSRVLAAVSLAKLLGETPRGSRHQRGHGT